MLSSGLEKAFGGREAEKNQIELIVNSSLNVNSQ
jgi:hypothetical protein